MCCQTLKRLLAIGALAVAGLAAAPAFAQTAPLDQRVTPELLQQVFPGATRLGPIDERRAFMPVYGINIHDEEELIGYVFSPLDLIRAPSYSPRPHDAIVGMETTGVITGIELLDYHDSYLVGFPERTALVQEFLDLPSATTRLSTRPIRPGPISRRE